MHTGDYALVIFFFNQRKDLYAQIHTLITSPSRARPVLTLPFQKQV